MPSRSRNSCNSRRNVAAGVAPRDPVSRTIRSSSASIRSCNANSALPRRAAWRCTAISTDSDQFVPAKASLPPVACHHARMADEKKQPRVQVVCGTCGSTDVSRDAWGDWNVATQQWELRSVYDDAHCHDCERETRL